MQIRNKRYSKVKTLALILLECVILIATVLIIMGKMTPFRTGANWLLEVTSNSNHGAKLDPVIQNLGQETSAIVAYFDQNGEKLVEHTDFRSNHVELPFWTETTLGSSNDLTRLHYLPRNAKWQSETKLGALPIEALKSRATDDHQLCDAMLLFDGEVFCLSSVDGWPSDAEIDRVYQDVVEEIDKNGNYNHLDMLYLYQEVSERTGLKFTTSIAK